jgi:hypothetical protein
MMLGEFTVCGQTGLLPTQRMLTSHLLALAAQDSLRCGEIPQTGRSVTSERVDSKPILRCTVFEQEGRGLCCHSQKVREWRPFLFLQERHLAEQEDVRRTGTTAKRMHIGKLRVC